MKRTLTLLLLALTFLQPLQAQWVGYVYVERLNLTDQQTATLIEELKTLGLDNQGPYPNLRNHWRIRPDQNAAIFECQFANDTISADAVKNRLAAIFGISPSLITYTTAQTQYGPVVTYAAGGQNRARFGIFGGFAATWRESWAAVIAYLLANFTAWEPATYE